MTNLIRWNDLIEQSNIVITTRNLLNNKECYFLIKSEQKLETSVVEENPLMIFPLAIREDITHEIYDPGMSSMAQKYIETTYCKENKSDELQKIFNNIYIYATKYNKHTLAYNIIVVLSQISYKYLGVWSQILAIAATRNKYIDIEEVGIRCFENWESKDACTFLKECRFSEPWLQKYADEVCKDIEDKGLKNNVLPEKNYPWKVAGTESDSARDVRGYSSRYSSVAV